MKIIAEYGVEEDGTLSSFDCRFSTGLPPRTCEAKAYAVSALLRQVFLAAVDPERPLCSEELEKRWATVFGGRTETALEERRLRMAVADAAIQYCGKTAGIAPLKRAIRDLSSFMEGLDGFPV